MKEVEKNDVDISKLFNWGGKLELMDNSGEIKFTSYIRIVGDAELNRARVLALRDSAALRIKLNDLSSDERMAYIPYITNDDKDSVIELIINGMIRQIASKIIKETALPYPTEVSSDATLEEQENYQKEVDEYPDKYQKTMEEKITKEVDAERNRLKEIDFDELVRLFNRYIIDSLCEKEMRERLVQYCVYFSCYKDSNFKKRTFSSFEEFDNLPTYIKNQFIDFYSGLDLDIEDLKK